MRRRWGITAVILLTLALGIGANVAIFSVVDGILFQPLPYPQPDSLLTPQNGYFPAGYYVGLAARDKTLDLAAFTGSGHVTLTLAGQPLQVNGSAVSANFFTVMGVTPALGRGFQPGENAPRADGFAVLSNRLWREKFSARRDILGAVVSLGGQDRQIVGVMPPGFAFPSADTDVWLPDRMDPGSIKDYWSTYSLQIVGRLRPGVTAGQARADMRQQAAAVAALFPYPTPANWGTIYPLITLRDSLVGSLATRFLLVLGAVGLVLLIACVNVVNLLLIELAGRRRELAVRMALGAGRGRIISQVLRQAVGLAVAGGALGLLLAAWGVPLLVHALPADTPHLAAAALHWRVFGFACALTVAVGALTGLLPGWRASGLNIEAELRAGGSSAGIAPARQRLANALLVAEVAIAVVVMVAGALLASSLVKLSHVNPGFDAAGVTTLGVAPTDAYCAVPGRCTDFYQRLQEHVAALPGVGAAALANAVPLGGLVPIAPVIFQEHPLLPGGAIPLVWANVVTPGYLRAMGIPLLAGRAFASSDGATAQKVVLVNAALARSLWPGEDPIGKTVTSVESGLANWTVVGVVADVRELVLSGDPAFFQGDVYFPYAQAVAAPPLQGSLAPMTLVLRAASPNAPLPSAADLRGIITGLDPDIPFAVERTMPSLVYANLAAPRTTTGMFLLFGLLALALGAIGVYGVMAHNVAQRTREFGVRMALGAGRPQLLRLVLGRGMALAAAGIVAGLAAAAALVHLLHGLLYDVSPADPTAFAAAAALVALVALVACFWPARRATRVDPLIALRQD